MLRAEPLLRTNGNTKPHFLRPSSEVRYDPASLKKLSQAGVAQLHTNFVILLLYGVKGTTHDQVHLLEAGHFALESQGPEIAAIIRDFLARKQTQKSRAA